PPFGFEEDHRIVRSDRLLDHPVPIGRAGAGYDFQSGGMREVHLRRFGVMLNRADPTTERDTDRNRHPERTRRAVVDLRDLTHDLVEPGIDEAVELDLAHRAVAANGQSDRCPDDA